jgi:hypothetical protein
MSITAGALDTINAFLTDRAQTGSTSEFPHWDSDSGRWALAHWAGISQESLESLPPEGVTLAWRVGDNVANLAIRPIEGRPGVTVGVIEKSST